MIAVQIAIERSKEGTLHKIKKFTNLQMKKYNTDITAEKIHCNLINNS